MSQFEQVIGNTPGSSQLANVQSLHGKKPRPVSRTGRRTLERSPRSPAITEQEIFGCEPLFDDIYTPNRLVHQNIPQIEHISLGDINDDGYTFIPEEQELGQVKQSYDHILAHREAQATTRKRLAIECIVAIDIKTNVIIPDEYSFMTGLSACTAELYQCPESSIVLTVQHTSCLLFGGSFDPAYVVTVSSIRQYLEPVFNSDNAAALQNHLQESIGVLPGRGLVKFEILAESNIATNGTTLRDEITFLEKKAKAEHASFKACNASTSKTDPNQGLKSMHNLKAASNLPTHHEVIVIPPESDDGASPPPPISRERNNYDDRLATADKLGRRKSFSAWIFGKGPRSERC